MLALVTSVVFSEARDEYLLGLEVGMRCETLNRVTAPILGAKVATYGAPYGIHGQCGGKLHCHGHNIWIVMVYVCVCVWGGEERERGGREK